MNRASYNRPRIKKTKKTETYYKTHLPTGGVKSKDIRMAHHWKSLGFPVQIVTVTNL